MISTCELCGEPMPEGEEMFKRHGYSGPCPKPPMIAMRPHSADDYKAIARRQREIVAERAALWCDCLKSLNLHGAVITTHVSGCPANNVACGCPYTLTGRGAESKSHVRDCPYASGERA